MTGALSALLAGVNREREAAGFLTLAGLLALAERGNRVLDPFSVLVSASAVVGSGNVFYPSVVLEARGGALAVGNGNTFFPGSVLLADSGDIAVGDDNQFGEGGFSARARPGASVEFGSRGRYMHGASIVGPGRLGSGSQVIGAVEVQDCVLEAGDDHTGPDPDSRGAVLKGCGRARGLTVGRGQAILGEGRFLATDLKPQSYFHPKG